MISKIEKLIISLPAKRLFINEISENVRDFDFVLLSSASLAR